MRLIEAACESHVARVERQRNSGLALPHGSAVPSTKFAAIAGAGHFPHIEQPNASAAQVLRFTDAGRQRSDHGK
jgi:pimeloyl-ACP methyl ester carboxylesterase